MGTISQRRRKDGTAVFRAQVRLYENKQLVYQDSKTFTRRPLAVRWLAQREAELETSGGRNAIDARRVTIGELIDRYLADAPPTIGRDKGSVLRFLRRQPLAERPALRLTAADLIAHIRQRRQTVGPATAANDLIYLGAIYRVAPAAYGVPLNPRVIDDARGVLREQHLIGKARRRARRPTADEMNRLFAYFESRDGRARIPMFDILAFAIHSTRRQDEITRLRWEDINLDEMTGVVRDHKHPREKAGNNREFKLTEEGMAIIQRQPKTDARIFPYDPKSVGSAFTRAHKFLGIDDLRFHDMRAEGVCMLFEAGYEIHEVAKFSLHQSWATLQIYERLKPGQVVLR